MPDTLRNNIERLINRTIANTAELIQTKRDLGRTKLAHEIRRKQKAQKNIQLKTGGVLIIEEGRDIVQKRVEDKLAKAKRWWRQRRKRGSV